MPQYVIHKQECKFVNKFFDIFIDYAITVVPLPPLHSTPSCPPLLPTFPPYSSCPCVILISSLASTFPTLFLPSPCLFSTYHLCYLFSVPLTPSPPPTPLLTTLMFQLFAQFALVFVLGVVVNNCEFAVIFTVPIFDLLFLR